MKKNYILLLTVLFLQFGCAVATDLHVMTDNFFGASNDLAKDKPELVIYDEAAYYNVNRGNDGETEKE